MAFIPGNNSANYQNCASWNLSLGNVTSVGTNGGPSAYGTLDQGGNVWEWLENTVETLGGFQKGIRGGSWNSNLIPNFLASTSSVTSGLSTKKSFNIGFRLVALSNTTNLIPFVGIGDINNEADTTGYGSVNYSYNIGLYPITNAQYVVFLNSVDASGGNIYGLYSSSMSTDSRGGIIFDNTKNNGAKYSTKTYMGNKPVNFVNWLCAARMCNWLHNNQSSNGTESGVYLLNGATSGYDFVRSLDAKYAIPSNNEWYKAAYYKANGQNSGYWLYPTQYDEAPTCVNASIIGDGPVVNIFPSPTPTPTLTPTSSITPTITPSSTILSTSTPTATITPTNTPTITLTQTNTPTISPTITSSPTPTITITSSITPTTTPTITKTPTFTPTTTNTVTPTSTVTRTQTKTPTPTKTVTPTNTISPTVTPSITPTKSLPAFDDKINNNLILDKVYSIKTYTGSTSLPLLSMPTDTRLINDWKIFMEHISTIYASDSLEGVTPVFWNIPSNSGNIPSPKSSLSSLTPDKSYYFILKDYPETPIKIPAIISQAPPICPRLSVFTDNIINISGVSGVYSCPVNISISGLDPNQEYTYYFTSSASSKPCSIYPISGNIVGNVPNNQTNIVSVFQFAPDVAGNAQVNLNTTNLPLSKETFAAVEFNLSTKNNNTNNTANFNKTAIWNNIDNLTDIQTNGASSFYGCYDMCGQLYELTDTNSDKFDYKIIRGGSWQDHEAESISKLNRKETHIDYCFSNGGLGFRLASLTNPNIISKYISNYVYIKDINNMKDSTGYGTVNYPYWIQENLVTNTEYCLFLNSVDPNGSNSTETYDIRMKHSAHGGIDYQPNNNIGYKYILKPNMGNKPVNFITWKKAAKYCNWINNNGADINYGSYDLYNKNTDRLPDANYFLPSENEWYKAAYYHPILNKYFKYATMFDEDPLSITSNHIGSGLAPYRSCDHNIKQQIMIHCSGYETVSMLNKQNAPKVSLINSHTTDAEIILSSSSGNIYNIATTITNLEPNEEYNYEFKSLGSNWPCSITPISGVFKSSGTTKNLSNVFSFCNNINNCSNNLTYIFDNNNVKYALQESSLYNILEFNLNKFNTTYKDIKDSIIIKCNNCLIPEKIADVEFIIPKTQINIDNTINSNTFLLENNGLTTGDKVQIYQSVGEAISNTSYWVRLDILPKGYGLYKTMESAMVGGSTNRLNGLAFIAGNYLIVESRRNNILTISPDLCEDYIPIVVNVTGAYANERYSYIFSSDDKNITFISAKAGDVYFGGNGSGQIVTYMKLNNTKEAILNIKLNRSLTGSSSTDSIFIKCGECNNSPRLCTPIATSNNDTVTPTITATPNNTVTPTRTVTPTITATPTVTPTTSPLPTEVSPPLVNGPVITNINDVSAIVDIQYSIDNGTSWIPSATTTVGANSLINSGLLSNQIVRARATIAGVGTSIWVTSNYDSYSSANILAPVINGSIITNPNLFTVICNIQYSIDNGTSWIPSATTTVGANSLINSGLLSNQIVRARFAQSGSGTSVTRWTT